MTMDRERTHDELIEESVRARNRLCAVTDHLNWLVSELVRVAELDEEDQERDGRDR